MASRSSEVNFTKNYTLLFYPLTVTSWLHSANANSSRDGFQNRYHIHMTFTAWRVCIARTMPSQDVCPSHASILSTPLSISSVFLPQGSPTILVFRYQTVWQYSDEDLPDGEANARGYKNRDFRPISRFISEMMQVRAIVTMEGKYETVYTSFRMAPFSMILNNQ